MVNLPKLNVNGLLGTTIGFSVNLNGLRLVTYRFMVTNGFMSKFNGRLGINYDTWSSSMVS